MSLILGQETISQVNGDVDNKAYIIIIHDLNIVVDNGCDVSVVSILYNKNNN